MLTTTVLLALCLWCLRTMQTIWLLRVGMVWVTSEKNILQTDFEGKNIFHVVYCWEKNLIRCISGKKFYYWEKMFYSNQITHTPPPLPHQHHPKVKWSVPKIIERQVQPGWLLIQLSVRLQTVPLLRWAPDMDNDLLSGLSLISFPERFSPCWQWGLAQEACNWLIIRRIDKLVHVISWRAATERVCINGVISSSLPITLGVSQGSILGALVFITNCILHEHEHLCRRYWLNL